VKSNTRASASCFASSARPAAAARRADHRRGDGSAAGKAAVSNAVARRIGARRARQVHQRLGAGQDRRLEPQAQGRPTDTRSTKWRPDGRRSSRSTTACSRIRAVVQVQGAPVQLAARIRCGRRRSIFRRRAARCDGVADADRLSGAGAEAVRSAVQKNGAGTRLVITVAGTQDQPKDRPSTSDDAQGQTLLPRAITTR
jgi:hypothetical protein